MWQRNNGKSETEIIQNQFTAYLTTAVQRRRHDYIQQQDRRLQMESLTEREQIVHTANIAFLHGDPKQSTGH